MYFSIGAHPAFLCPINQEGNQTDYSIRFDTQNPIHYQKLNGEGLLVKKPFHEQAILATTDYLLPITNDLFKEGAFIIENNQCHKVSLVNADKKTYVSVSFDAALFGLWSPINNAPFICIEPWYGRCDSSDFCGSLEEREWGNQLNAGMQFIASYTIEIA
jgi:galactose mutarotase-like enzyme